MALGHAFDEVILGCAEGIETVFDGTREVPFLGWRPDYTGYNATCTPDQRERAGCLAHVRRKFHDAQSSAPEAALALLLEIRGKIAGWTP